MTRPQTLRESILRHLEVASLEIDHSLMALALFKKDKKGDPDWDRLSRVGDLVAELVEIYRRKPD